LQQFLYYVQKMTVRLSELPAGATGIITRFDDEFAKIKLMEMGCLPGERVSVEVIAPLGDPIIIKVTNYKLSLRKAEAFSIWVEV
jgi:ferrous iron transport protein A